MWVLSGVLKVSRDWLQRIALGQTWSSRDLSLGLEMSRDPFLQVLVSVSVLNIGVLVLVLVLELETVETRSSSLMKRETETR